MAVTRDPNFPPEIAQLMQAFNMAADGHDAMTVLNASAQMLAASIGFVARERGAPVEKALEYTDHIAGVVKREVRENWQRKPDAADVEVKLS